jgi:DTW domain-containing protein YfiP
MEIENNEPNNMRTEDIFRKVKKLQELEQEYKDLDEMPCSKLPVPTLRGGTSLGILNVRQNEPDYVTIEQQMFVLNRIATQEQKEQINKLFSDLIQTRLAEIKKEMEELLRET